MHSESFILQQLLSVIQHQRSAVRDMDLDLLEELVLERKRLVAEAGLFPRSGPSGWSDTEFAHADARQGWENLVKVQSMDLLLKDELDELILKKRKALKDLTSHSSVDPGE